MTTPRFLVRVTIYDDGSLTNMRRSRCVRLDMDEFEVSGECQLEILAEHRSVMELRRGDWDE